MSAIDNGLNGIQMFLQLRELKRSDENHGIFYVG